MVESSTYRGFRVWIEGNHQDGWVCRWEHKPTDQYGNTELHSFAGDAWDTMKQCIDAIFECQAAAMLGGVE